MHLSSLKRVDWLIICQLYLHEKKTGAYRFPPQSRVRSRIHIHSITWSSSPLPASAHHSLLSEGEEQSCPTTRLTSSERCVARCNGGRDNWQSNTKDAARSSIANRHKCRATSLADAVGSGTAMYDRSEDSHSRDKDLGEMHGCSLAWCCCRNDMV